MPGIFHVRDYGALGDGSTDDTSAIQDAIDAAKAYGGPPVGPFLTSAVVEFDNGTYCVSSLDCTGAAGLELRGKAAWGVSLYANKQTGASKPVLDFTGSSACKVAGIVGHGQNPDGTMPSVLPSCAYLWAQSSSGADSNKNRMDDCGSIGQFSSAALCIIGSTDNAFYSCAFQQDHVDRPTLNISLVPDWYVTSPFKTITSGAQNVGDNSFFACEFHAHRSSSATCWTLYGRGVDNLRFFGGNCDNSGPAHLLIQGSNNRKICFFGVKFYSESGHAADHLFRFDSAVNGFIEHGCNYTDNAFSGAKITGTTPSNYSVLG